MRLFILKSVNFLMIRQQNKNSFILMIITSILELLIIVGAYMINYYTRVRMGMARHVIYLNRIWEEDLPILTIKILSLLIIIGFGIFTYIHYSRKKNNDISKKIAIILNYVIIIWTVYFLLFYSTERNRGYYILSMCFVVITILQNIVSNCYILIKSN